MRSALQSAMMRGIATRLLHNRNGALRVGASRCPLPRVTGSFLVALFLLRPVAMVLRLLSALGFAPDRRARQRRSRYRMRLWRAFWNSDPQYGLGGRVVVLPVWLRR